MIITYDNKIKKKLENEHSIKKYYGKQSTRIITLISMLQVVTCLDDIPNVPPTRRHKLVNNYKNCWGIDVDKNWRMILVPVSNLSEDPKDVKEVIISDIVDYH